MMQAAVRKPRVEATTASVSDLYKAFAEAVAALALVTDQDQRRWERAVDVCGKLAQRIAAAPAADVDEMLLKIRVAGWALGRPHKRLEDLDRWEPAQPPRGACGYEEQITLASIREDLRRMQAR
jgi:hypothetical protein